MYGTVARMRAKPGAEEKLMKMADEGPANPAGFLFSHVYKLDSGNNEYILAVGFKDKESYVANANSPQQHEEYLQYRELLESDPEWHDGEIVQSVTA